MKSRRIADAVRRRERERGLARVQAERAKERAIARMDRRVARRKRKRVELFDDPHAKERTLVFRGPHANFDFIMTGGMLGGMVVLPAIIGLGFLLPMWATALLVVVTAAVYAWLIMSPFRITVTDDGYFMARRAGMPWSGDFGRVADLELRSGYDDWYFKTCSARSHRWEMFEAHKLTPEDVATIERFEEAIRKPRPLPETSPHDGGYRKAA